MYCIQRINKLTNDIQWDISQQQPKIIKRQRRWLAQEASNVLATQACGHEFDPQHL